MTLQIEFDKTINLLHKNRSSFNVEKLLDIYKTSELTFHCFEGPGLGNEKKHLLDIYEMRAKFETERKNNPHVFGYETMLGNFRKTKHEHICISSFTTEVGSFIAFSDFGKTDLIGVLFSTTTLQNSRDIMNEHRKMVESMGKTVQYDYTANEALFKNGLHLKI